MGDVDVSLDGEKRNRFFLSMGGDGGRRTGYKRRVRWVTGTRA